MMIRILSVLLMLTFINANYSFAVSIVTVHITNVEIKHECGNVYIFGDINIRDGASISVSLYDGERNKIGQTIETIAYNNSFKEKLDINLSTNMITIEFIIDPDQKVFHETRTIINKPMFEDYLIIQQKIMMPTISGSVDNND